MGDESDVFQDFSSDASGSDDDMDWKFTDGENASILQLMGETTPTKLIVTTVEEKPTANSEPSVSIEKELHQDCYEEKLLDELFPLSKPLKLQKDDNCSTECEVEWGLKTPRLSSPTRGDANLESLFEEMYGGDKEIALSPTQHKTKEVKEIVLKQENVCLSMKADQNTSKNVPVELVNMLKLILKKITERKQDLSSHLYSASRRLCLLDYDDEVTFDSVSSLDSLLKFVCSLEERLKTQEFIISFAPTRTDRLELVLVTIDQNVDALSHSLKSKCRKIIDMLPLLAKMREQSQPLVPITLDQPSALQIETKASPFIQRKSGKRSPLQGWATFHPEKMPAKRSESSLRSKQSNSKKPRVRIRQYIPSKLRVRCKMYNSEDSELTFRPKINKKSSNYHKSEREDFTTRMQRDISQRLTQKKKYEYKREQHDREEENVSATKLIDKGSERILLKNGMWTESLEERISRLAKHRPTTELSASRSKKRRQRQQERKREAAAVASRACESLYQRGIEQRKREKERLQEATFDLEFQRNRPKINSRSVRVMKTRIRQELAQLCADSQQTASEGDVQAETRESSTEFVTFVQFSCALLYFGCVTDVNTLWEGSMSDGNDGNITLLWYSWTVFTRNDTGVPGSHLAIKLLERVLFSVILGGQIGEHSSLQTRDVQILLRLYRANYYSQKHTKPKIDDQLHKVCTQETNHRRRQRVRYSLHGKPIRYNGTSETDLLSERELLLRAKLDEMREVKAKQEVEGCTFRPQINSVPSKLATRETSPLKPSSATVSTFERLYSDAFQRQNNVLEKYLEAKLHREELEKRECSVHPSYINGLTIEERLKNLHLALADNALPADFHKKIEAMRTATEMKVLDEQIKEQRLQPVQFRKAKDGRTIVLPFQFATEIRAALSTEVKKQRSTRRPRDQLMKGLRPRKEEEERDIASKNHKDFVVRNADLCLDVHVSPTETHQLYLNIHDDPREVVESFAQRFSLTNTQRYFLMQLVEARLEQLTNCI